MQVASPATPIRSARTPAIGRSPSGAATSRHWSLLHNGRGGASGRRVFYRGQNCGLNFAVSAPTFRRRSEHCVRGADVGRACEQQDAAGICSHCASGWPAESETQISVSIRRGSRPRGLDDARYLTRTVRRSINSSNSIQVRTRSVGATVHDLAYSVS